MLRAAQGVAPGGSGVTSVAPGSAEPPACAEMLAARAAMTPEQRAFREASLRAVREMHASKQKGPGAEMKKLLGELGFTSTSNCGCNKMVSRINAWSVKGCERHREEFLAWLRGQQAKWRWSEKVTAAMRAVTSGLFRRLNPLDPAPGLLDEALRRARLNGVAGRT